MKRVAATKFSEPWPQVLCVPAIRAGSAVCHRCEQSEASAEAFAEAPSNTWTSF